MENGPRRNSPSKDWRRLSRYSEYSHRIKNTDPEFGTVSETFPGSGVNDIKNDEQPALVYDSVVVFERETFNLQKSTTEQLGQPAAIGNPHRSAAQEIRQQNLKPEIEGENFPDIDDESDLWETSSFEIEGSPRYTQIQNSTSQS